MDIEERRGGRERERKTKRSDREVGQRVSLERWVQLVTGFLSGTATVSLTIRLRLTGRRRASLPSLKETKRFRYQHLLSVLISRFLFQRAETEENCMQSHQRRQDVVQLGSEAAL